MAINSITFGGVNSADFGIYISGEGVFNAPERDVEMIEIPGRNGELALDKGRFRNIEVTYPAFNFEPNDYDTFTKNLSDFRNAICSQIGYQRLTDTFHPDEYRMATYIGGLEIKPVKYNTASEFDIVFNCKPQRWLTDGEEPITIGEWRDTETVSGDIVEVENPDGVLGVKSLSVSLEPIQSGSGTPSPDNVRPISGRTECDTYVSGVNVWDEEYQNGYWSTSDGTFHASSGQLCSKNYISVKPNTAYHYHKGGGTTNGEVLYFDASKTYISSGGSRGNQNFTTPNNCYFIQFNVGSSYGATYNNDISINYPSTDTSYHAYEGNQYTTTLGRTVYGGRPEIVSGNLSVTKLAFNARDVEWIVADSTRIYTQLPLSPTELTTILCSHCEYVRRPPAGSLTAWVDWGGYPNSNKNLILALGEHTTSLENWNAYIQNNDVQFVYELATPQTYQLTETEVELLTGENNVWSDGSVTLEYGQPPNIVFNPTLFEASPMLEVEGYGTIGFNGYEIELTNDTMGDIQIFDGKISTSTGQARPNYSQVNTGDTLTISDSITSVSFKATDTQLLRIWKVTNSNFTVNTGSGSVTSAVTGTKEFKETFTVNGDTAVYGTAKTIFDGSVDVDIEWAYRQGGASRHSVYRISLVVSINTAGVLTFSKSRTHVSDSTIQNTTTIASESAFTVNANSSVTLLGHPTYVDCDLGETYKVDSGEMISLNRYIDLGSDLPTLASGTNTFTFDNTITDLKVVPRWWKI